MSEQRNVVRRLVFDEDDAERGPDVDIAGDADINDFLQQELARIDREAMEKWNFDFKNEVPLEGQWQWIRVSPPEGTAAATATAQQPPIETQPQPQQVVQEHRDHLQQEEEEDGDDEPNR